MLTLKNEAVRRYKRANGLYSWPNVEYVKYYIDAVCECVSIAEDMIINGGLVPVMRGIAHWANRASNT